MIEKSVTDDGSMVTTVLSGNITGRDVLNDFFEMIKRSDQLNPAGFSHLYDMSAVEAISVEENDVRRLTSLGIAHRVNKLDVRTAIVATVPETRKLAFLHKQLSNTLGIKKVEVFGNRPEALKWLENMNTTKSA